MKLQFPKDVSQFHHADGTLYTADAEGMVIVHGKESLAFTVAGFTVLEADPVIDASAITTIDAEGDQVIPKGTTSEGEQYAQ